MRFNALEQSNSFRATNRLVYTKLEELLQVELLPPFMPSSVEGLKLPEVTELSEVYS